MPGFLHRLFMRAEPPTEEAERAKEAEVEVVLAKSDDALAEKDRVVEAFRDAERAMRERERGGP